MPQALGWRYRTWRGATWAVERHGEGWIVRTREGNLVASGISHWHEASALAKSLDQSEIDAEQT
jgi:hypothetical protein